MANCIQTIVHKKLFTSGEQESLLNNLPVAAPLCGAPERWDKSKPTTSIQFRYGSKKLLWVYFAKSTTVVAIQLSSF